MRRRSSVGVALCGLCLTVLAGTCARADPPLDWPLVDALITEHFPDVPSVTTPELASLLSGGTDVILLDARAPEEYAVSHLKEARLAFSADEAAALLEAADPDAVVVAYCSVGYRSAALTEQLRARGFENVYNLQGSIFEWANEGRPVFRDGAAVAQVHPYDDAWGQLLAPELRASIQTRE